MARPILSRGRSKGVRAAIGATATIAAVLGGLALLRLAGLLPAASVVDHSAGSTAVGSVAPEMAAWVAAAPGPVWTSLHRLGPAPAMSLARLERCGDLGLAFFVDPSPTQSGPYLYAEGPFGPPLAGAPGGGIASSFDDPEVAFLRSQAVPCGVIVDTVIDPDRAIAALAGTGSAGTSRQLLATTLVVPGAALVYVADPVAGQRHESLDVVRWADHGWVATGGQGGGPSLAAAGLGVGVIRVGTVKGLPVDRDAAVGRFADDESVAVELDFGGFAHRYPVAGGAFVVVLPADVGFGLAYRFLDAAGTVRSSGVTAP